MRCGCGFIAWWVVAFGDRTGNDSLSPEGSEKSVYESIDHYCGVNVTGTEEEGEEMGKLEQFGGSIQLPLIKNIKFATGHPRLRQGKVSSRKPQKPLPIGNRACFLG